SLLTALLKELDRLAKLTSPSEKLTEESLAQIAKTIQETPAAKQHATGIKIAERMASTSTNAFRAIVLKGPISKDLYEKWKDDNSPWAKAARAEWELMSGKQLNQLSDLAKFNVPGDSQFAIFVDYLNAMAESQGSEDWQWNKSATRIDTLCQPDAVFRQQMASPERIKACCSILLKAIRRNRTSMEVEFDVPPRLKIADDAPRWVETLLGLDNSVQNRAAASVIYAVRGKSDDARAILKAIPAILSGEGKLSSAERIVLGMKLMENRSDEEQLQLRSVIATLWVDWVDEQLDELHRKFLDSRKAKSGLKTLSVKQFRLCKEAEDQLGQKSMRVLTNWADDARQKMGDLGSTKDFKKVLPIFIARARLFCVDRFHYNSEFKIQLKEHIADDLLQILKSSPEANLTADELGYGGLICYYRILSFDTVLKADEVTDSFRNYWKDALRFITKSIASDGRNPIAHSAAAQLYELLYFPKIKKMHEEFCSDPQLADLTKCLQYKPGQSPIEDFDQLEVLSRQMIGVHVDPKEKRLARVYNPEGYYIRVRLLFNKATASAVAG
ncbi:MAG: hypothetical protein ACRCZF_25580, partial [Gemmataceae bacterium]